MLSILCVEFDSTLAKMHSRKSSLGPNNPTSWMDKLNSNLSQQLKPEEKGLRRDAHGISTLRNIAVSVNRTQK